MFIELTDLLRCPEPHEEQYLVLLPGRMEGRSVQAGELGCPVCHRGFAIREGVVEMGGWASADAVAEPAVDSLAIAAFVGLSGPGGYLATVGAVPGLGADLVEAIPGVHLAAVNPPAGVLELPMLSLLRAPMLPVRSRTLRGVVIGEEDSRWIGESVRVTLPGLRVVGRGQPPDHPGLEVLAAAGGWWVALRR